MPLSGDDFGKLKFAECHKEMVASICFMATKFYSAAKFSLPGTCTS